MGLIPAHAGKTPSRRSRTDPPRAHPRSRGENRAPVAKWRDRGGSSPLTRGKQLLEIGEWVAHGLIPAHAGKTAVPNQHGHANRAHPRSRGENPRALIAFATSSGSSPLTRGKPGLHRGGRCPRGLIPAHAGKTASTLGSSSRSTAHPRSRGENFAWSPPGRRRPGSSPLTRGKPGRRRSPSGPPGLIPAHAGKTTAESM